MNADRNIPYVGSIQKVDDTLIIQNEDCSDMYYDKYDYSTRGIWDYYDILDINTGEIIRQGEVEVDLFHNYG